MEAIYYRWSGNHKTVVDLGNKDITVAAYLGIAIKNQKDFFKKSVKEKRSHFFISKIKDEIRSMQELSDLLWVANNTCVIVDQEYAAKKAYRMIMPWRKD